MQFEELRFICLEAAVDLARNRARPLPVTLVLPGSERTRLLTLPDFPVEDEARHAYLSEVARSEVADAAVPCWGFIAEAEIDGEDTVVVVFGARRHAPHLTASRVAADGHLEEFVPSEELDPTAMPFLHPLQHAVDSLSSEPDTGPGPGGAAGLPILPE